MDRFKPEKLIVVPAAVSPFKVSKQDVLSLPDALRVAMVRAAFAGIDRVEVDTMEIDRGGVSYAIDTVRAIAASHPAREIVFLVGEDAMALVDKWKNAAELKRLCVFRPFPRTRESSTEIRRRLAAGDNSAFDDIPPAAAKLMMP